MPTLSTSIRDLNLVRAATGSQWWSEVSRSSIMTRVSRYFLREIQLEVKFLQRSMQTTTLTAPVRLSTLQSGMIFESVTIQLFILSLLLLSTAKRKKAVVHMQLFKKRSTIRGPLYTSTYHYRLCSSDTINTRDASDHTHTPSLCCALRLSSLGARGPSTFLQTQQNKFSNEIVNENVGLFNNKQICHIWTRTQSNAPRTKTHILSFFLLLLYIMAGCRGVPTCTIRSLLVLAVSGGARHSRTFTSDERFVGSSRWFIASGLV